MRFFSKMVVEKYDAVHAAAAVGRYESKKKAKK